MTDPTPVETPYGTLYVDPEELVIGRLLQENGAIPDISEEVAFFQKYLTPGDTAIDVGANYGLFTLALARLVGEKGTVIAFEPNGDMVEYWNKTMFHLGANRSMWSMWAVGKSNGYGTLRRDPRGSGGSQVIPTDTHEDADTSVETLDTFKRRMKITAPIKAIKIDAEGMDVDVLLGAEQILKEDRPVVIFEWNPEAMQSLGKDPEEEFITLLMLGSLVEYDAQGLDGEETPDPFLGNIAFVPDY